MDLFTRDAILIGPPAQTRQWATDVAAAFTTATGKPIAVWTSIAGGTVGHYVWGRQVDGVEDVVTAGMQAMLDQAYLDEVGRGLPLVRGEATDTIYTPLNDLPPDTTQPGNIAMITKASAKAGSLPQAMEWGIKALEFGQAATGATTTLLSPKAGPYSALVWMTIFPDAAAADGANQKLMVDPGYLGHLASGTEVFENGSGNQQLFLRLA